MMKTYMTRLFTVLMLAMVSMGAWADVKIFYGEEGKELKDGETKINGGSITIEQKASDDSSQTTVYLTFTPETGYTISTDNIKVYAVISPNSSSTRAPEISGDALKLNKEDSKDDSQIRYSVKIDSKLGLWVKEVTFQPSDKKGGGEPTRTTFPTVTTDTNNPVYYLIQSYVNTGFYMRPNDTNVNTLNTLTDEMKWFFLDAGTGTEGSDEVHYYYICRKNGNDIQYMYFSGPNFVSTSASDRIWIKLQAKSGSDDNFKFYIVANTSKGGYNIIPKGTDTSNKSSLNKQGGNAGSGDVQVGSGLNDEGSCWYIIALTDYMWTLRSDCFTVSDATNKYFYKIRSQNNANYYIKPDATYVVTSNTVDDDMIWYFEEAASDNLMTYYYIRHANTGQYLRYRSSNVGEENAIELANHTGSETGDDEARFQFVVARGTNSNESVKDPKGIIFNIIPKLFINTSTNNIRSLSCDKGQGKALKTKEDRFDNKTHWSFVSTEYSTICANPTITFSNATGKATIATTTTSNRIYYTVDGTEPSSTNGTEYGGPFNVTEQTTIKAIVTRTGFTDSEVTTKTIYKVATPTIQNNGSNAISITTSTTGDDIHIYYTIDGTAPTTSSTEYTGVLREGFSGENIKAIAVKGGWINSEIGTGSVTLQCESPVLTRSDNTLSISCAFPSTATIYYIKNGGDTNPSSASTQYGGTPIEVVTGDVIKAIAIADGYENSIVVSKKIFESLTPTDGKCIINSQEDFEKFVDMASTSEGAAFHYILKTNVTAGSPISQPFTGTLEAGADENGNYYSISGLCHPLFSTISGGTVKNVMLDNVSISSGTNVGAICSEATGDSRIYNCGVLATNSVVETDKDGYTHITTCSSTIGGSGFVGGIVGLLDGSSRVINCFSYANITDGNLVGGIVGKNNVATTSANLQTMVMNCMFYGDITGGTSKAPIYNGEIITNRSDQSGVSNFNYFWAGASYVQNQAINVYNCALSAETRFLQRFEFFRPLLNSNRELAAWWTTGSRDDKNEMLKWVLEPSQIGTSTPYPILKAPYDSNNKIIKYSSVVNIDADHAEAFSSSEETKKTQYNQGRKFDVNFTINIRMGTSGYDGYHPAKDAEITTEKVYPNITDKDPAHFNFNYYKVQLPYYNDVGTNNYRKDASGISRVVTGWKIVGTSDNSFSTGPDASASVDANGDITLTTPYNFANRKSIDKDLYSVSGRVFNQGAYLDVPEGVTSITIEPYWAKCVYVADAYPDVVYDQDMTTSSNATTVGTTSGNAWYTNGNSYSINNENQVVYTSMSNAAGQMPTSGNVYDNAIVLVGNVHSLDISNKTDSRHYTIMSIDLDKDNEPDYSYILRFNGRVRVHPVRVDFLNVIGLGMAQKSSGGTGTYNFGIMQPLNWFESTNTSLFRVTQFEYDREGRTGGPMILHGGVIEQWVTVAETNPDAAEANKVDYYHVGSNVWFKEFHIGAHQDKLQVSSPHPPISVTGGDYDIFYLTGYYNTPGTNYGDNAECYINGGRFGKVVGTGMQGLGKTSGADNTGNIIWQIDNADIDEFYAGGMNAAHKAEGNIWTVISNSRVDLFCGGPKFGDMNSKKQVVTNATNCTFRTFFGAGYGGNSYNRRYPSNKNNVTNINWDNWVKDQYKNEYNATYKGVDTRIDYQFIPNSGNTTNVARLFVDHVSFSLATTHDVTSKLTDCTITTSKLGRLELFDQCIGNFYGGGSLGKVTGPVNSTLINCIVEGNVFGAGYSATLPTVNVMNKTFQKAPRYDEDLGAYMEAVLPATNEPPYEWKPLPEGSTTYVDNTNHILYTKAEDLSESNLGSVNGNVTLTLTTSGNNGKTKIGTDGNNTTGNVYGGGEESYVTGANNIVTVNLQGNTEVLGNVFGGGNKGEVQGTTKVNVMYTE